MRAAVRRLCCTTPARKRNQQKKGKGGRTVVAPDTVRIEGHKGGPVWLDSAREGVGGPQNKSLHGEGNFVAMEAAARKWVALSSSLREIVPIKDLTNIRTKLLPTKEIPKQKELLTSHSRTVFNFVFLSVIHNQYHISCILYISCGDQNASLLPGTPPPPEVLPRRGAVLPLCLSSLSTIPP